MPLILLILRLLFGWIAPWWNESVPLAVRRDGRLVNRLQPQGVEPAESERAPGPLLLLWRAIVRALTRFRGGSSRPPGAGGPRGD
ncbi:MAG: hypothetical protein L0211_26425 [Planctomycetaceae bacterium]|nr:hypothetical protein [Planctomycetaceae bacterium]